MFTQNVYTCTRVHIGSFLICTHTHTHITLLFLLFFFFPAIVDFEFILSAKNNFPCITKWKWNIMWVYFDFIIAFIHNWCMTLWKCCYCRAIRRLIWNDYGCLEFFYSQTKQNKNNQTWSVCVCVCVHV